MEDPNEEWKRAQGFDPDEPGIFDSVSQEAVDAADARGMADHAAGRKVSNLAVLRWLESYMRGEKLPLPKAGD